MIKGEEDFDGGAQALLVEMAQNADETAITRLIETVTPTMLTAAASVLAGDLHLAEDAVQEGWLSILSSLSQYGGKGSFTGWACTIARSKAKNLLRKRNKLPIESCPPETIFEQLNKQTDTNWSQTFVPNESEFPDHALETALQTLTTKERRIVRSRYHDESSIAQIAAYEGCAEGTVKATLHEAKRKIAERLKKNKKKCKSD